MAAASKDSKKGFLAPVENIAELKKHSVSVYQFVPKHIGELLVEAGVISPVQLKEALIEQSKTTGMRLGDILENHGLATREEIDQALCQRFGVPFVRLSHFDIDPRATKLVPAHIARKHTVLPLLLDTDKLIVAVADPTDTDLINMLRFITGKVVEIGVATPEEIRLGISRCYGGEEVQHALEHIETPASTEPYHLDANEAENLANQRPVVQLVQNLILDAMARRASDIHIRPGEKRCEVFFRIDGQLISVQTFDKNLLPALVSRIKIISNLDISERRLPQDGRSRIRYMGKVVDLRVSVMPSVHGESVVIRLLDTQFAMASLEELGFSGDDATRLRHLLSRNNGIFLVTGPTGSGKSTTLYTALAQIRQRNLNIITVEDPVEYRVDGITQVQVNHQTGYTFARALRHILRHDPDVIMVGEIRDQETARMAVESALTGHLVLSTLHTNDAATTVARLLEIGIEPYLVNSSLLGVLAQRLVRCNCPYCLVEESVDPSVRAELEVDPGEVFYRGKGCEHCHETGVHGRRAVYELLTVSPHLKTLISGHANASEIQARAISDGMSQLTDHALSLARQKLISLEEVYRVRLE
ncbi:MAG: GspE/PulE family protein [Ketobacteraceae bacterium]|nr:GspE/PulE family protein [Ketobacteraceae bacterium]